MSLTFDIKCASCSVIANCHLPQFEFLWPTLLSISLLPRCLLYLQDSDNWALYWRISSRLRSWKWILMRASKSSGTRTSWSERSCRVHSLVLGWNIWVDSADGPCLHTSNDNDCRQRQHWGWSRCSKEGIMNTGGEVRPSSALVPWAFNR